VTNELASRNDDVKLLSVVKAGNPSAYRGIVEKYQSRVYAMVYGMVRNREDAMDITQDAFVKAFWNLSSFQLESSFYCWMYRIAMNMAIDFLRKQPPGRRRKVINTVDESSGDAKDLARRRFNKRIMDAVDELPLDQKEAILLRELEGLSYKEISDIMGIPEGSVMSRLFYARKKLQQVLANKR